MPAAAKRRREPRPEYVIGLAGGKYSSAEREHVGVVVLAAIPRGSPIIT